MANYTTINPDWFLPGAPAIGAQVGAIAENTDAITEGADGAPKISGAALGDYWLGVGTIGSASYATYAQDLSRVAVVRISGLYGSGGTPTVDRISLSSDGGSTWGADQTISIPVFTPGYDAYFNLETGAIVSTSGAGTFTPLANCNAVRFRWDGGGVDTAVITVYAIKGRV